MRISDWSSDVCSSDLSPAGGRRASFGADPLRGFAYSLRRGKLHLCSTNRITWIGAAGQRVGRQVPGDGLQVAPHVAGTAAVALFLAGHLHRVSHRAQSLDNLRREGAGLGLDHVRHPLVVVARQRGNLLRVERSEEHTSELQSLMRISYAVFALKQIMFSQYD